MRLARLRLLAFGPFTGRELSFDRGPRDLHLIFGENEAGKSSALSAITDLRFGIPQQSVHDFIHPYARMRIGATVQWPDGASIDVLRRKGRGATLTLADEHGEDTGEPVDADLLEALTGGLERERYEREFGIDHERLREGGRHLLRGGGELGATLFEASSGVADVNAVLERLETRARELFVPDARAKKGRINAALNALRDARGAVNAATTRPTEWTRLESAARGAREDLEAHASELARVNQRLRELEGLRARLPLLASLDALSAERAAIGPVALLGPDAAQRRRDAQGERDRARKRIAEIEREQASLGHLLAREDVDHRLLAQAATINRLHAGIPEARARAERIARRQAAVARLDARRTALTREADLTDISADAVRSIAHGAPREALGEALDSLMAASAQLDEAIQRECSACEPEPGRADAAQDGRDEALTRLRAALDVARGVAVTAESLAELLSAWSSAQGQASMLRRALEAQRPRDQDGESRPLLEADIDAAVRARDELADRCRSLADERERIGRDLAEARARHDALEAELPDLVSERSLAQARAHRDAAWQRVRRAYVAREPGTMPMSSGADADADAGDEPARAFERALLEADRQSDALRRDAERLAQVAQAERSAAVLAARSRAVEQDEARARAAMSGFDEEWRARLRDRRLPDLLPGALDQWQVQRLRVLEHEERSAERRRSAAVALARVCDASVMLDRALRALGGDTGADSASASASHAVAAEDLSWVDPVAIRTELQDRQRLAARLLEHHQASLDARVARARECESAREALARARARHAAASKALSPWMPALWLDATTDAGVVRARLSLLDRIARLDDERDAEAGALADDLVLAEIGVHEHAQLLAALADSAPTGTAHAVADGSGTAPSAAWIEALAQRLSDAQRRARERDAAITEHDRLAREREALSLHAAAAERTLAALCLEAGGGTAVDERELPAIEAAVGRAASIDAEIHSIRERLLEGADEGIDALRARLADTDAATLATTQATEQMRLERLREQEPALRSRWRECEAALGAVDASDAAALHRAQMEEAVGEIEAAAGPWLRLRLAHALLLEALGRYRERAQAPVLAQASEYFARMTGGRYVALRADAGEDAQPRLLAQRDDGALLGAGEFSEGTADQLYLALRLAALDTRSDARAPMPLVLDDVLITSDDARAARMLDALAQLATRRQVLVFTHHRHLVELARAALGTQVRVHLL